MTKLKIKKVSLSQLYCVRVKISVMSSGLPVLTIPPDQVLEKKIQELARLQMREELEGDPKQELLQKKLVSQLVSILTPDEQSSFVEYREGDCWNLLQAERFRAALMMVDHGKKTPAEIAVFFAEQYGKTHHWIGEMDRRELMRSFRSVDHPRTLEIVDKIDKEIPRFLPVISQEQSRRLWEIFTTEEPQPDFVDFLELEEMDRNGFVDRDFY